MVSQTEFYLFVLAAILIVSVYYIGVKTDIGAFSSLVNSAGNVFTGRNAGGTFQGLPTGS